MNDEPAPTPPSQPATSSRGLVLPANFVDVTAEQIGTVIGIIGAPGRKPRNSSCHLPASAIWHQLQARAVCL